MFGTCVTRPDLCSIPTAAQQAGFADALSGAIPVRSGTGRGAALRSFGARAASRATASFTYRQAVAVPTSNPAAQLGERLVLSR
jgi:hypothetical protein